MPGPNERSLSPMMVNGPGASIFEENVCVVHPVSLMVAELYSKDFKALVAWSIASWSFSFSETVTLKTWSSGFGVRGTDSAITGAATQASRLAIKRVGGAEAEMLRMEPSLLGYGCYTGGYRFQFSKPVESACPGLALKTNADGYQKFLFRSRFRKNV